MQKRKLWLFLAVLFIAINVRAHYYPGPSLEIEVSQTHLSGARDSVLLAKRPLVILDCVTSHQDLVRLSAFRLLHIKALGPRISLHREGDPHLIATARFTILFQAQEKSSRVEIRHPVTAAGAIIVLHRHQTLVLPPRWRYACLDSPTTMLELHDCTSLMLRLLHITKVSQSDPMQP